MGSQDLMSINTVAARLGLSVHQLRRWELMFGLDIKRGRGQQRQYRPEDLTVLERIKELVEQGWPTSQIRPQIEAEGLITPRLIGVPQQPGNPEVVLESIIGFRNFSERRFIEISKQIDELRQLVISITLKQELAGEADSPWKPVQDEEDEVETDTEPVEPIPQRPVEEITLGPQVAVSTDMHAAPAPPEPPVAETQRSQPESALIPASSTQEGRVEDEEKGSVADVVSEPVQAASPVQELASDSVAASQPDPAPESASAAAPSAPPSPPAKSASASSAAYHIDEVTDQNYLTVLGKALDIIGWTDEQADEFSEKTYQVPHWDELGRSHAEKMVAHIKSLLNKGNEESEQPAQSGSDTGSEAEKAVEALGPAEEVSGEDEEAPAPATAPAPMPAPLSEPAPLPRSEDSSSETGALPQPIIKPLASMDEPQAPPQSSDVEGEGNQEGSGDEQSFSP